MQIWRLVNHGNDGWFRRLLRHDWQFAIDTVDELKAIDVRHAHIGDDDIGRVGIQDLQRLGCRRRCSYPGARHVETVRRRVALGINRVRIRIP